MHWYTTMVAVDLWSLSVWGVQCLWIAEHSARQMGKTVSTSSMPGVNWLRPLGFRVATLMLGMHDLSMHPADGIFLCCHVVTIITRGHSGDVSVVHHPGLKHRCGFNLWFWQDFKGQAAVAGQLPIARFKWALHRLLL